MSGHLAMLGILLQVGSQTGRRCRKKKFDTDKNVMLRESPVGRLVSDAAVEDQQGCCRPVHPRFSTQALRYQRDTDAVRYDARLPVSSKKRSPLLPLHPHL